MYIGHYIELKYWDKKNKTVRKSHPNSNRLNNLLISKLVEVNKMLQKLYLHSSITTTMSYQANFISEKTDKALDKLDNF